MFLVILKRQYILLTLLYTAKGFLKKFLVILRRQNILLTLLLHTAELL